MALRKPAVKRKAAAAPKVKPAAKPKPARRKTKAKPAAKTKARAAKSPAKPAAKPRKTRAKAPAKKPGARAKKPASKVVDLAALGAAVVGVAAKTVLIEMSIDAAAKFFPKPLEESGPSRVVEGVERELKEIRKRDKELADSALAGSVFALAREIDSPTTSPNAKAACVKEMRETLGKLHGQVPEETKGRLHAIQSGRADRLAAGSPAG